MKKLLFTCVGFVTLMFTSCQNKFDDFQSSGDNKGFVVSYSVPNSELVGPSTRATVEATTDENAINKFYILFFERNAQGEGKFLEVYDASPASGQTLSPNGVLDINFPAGSTLDQVSAYNMLMLVNIDRYLNGQDVATWLQSFAGKTQNQVEAEYTATTSTTNPIISSDIFMSAKSVKEVGKSKVVVELERGVVRVDVQNNTNTDIYNLTSASIWNVYPSTYIWNSNAPKSYGSDRIKEYSAVTGITTNKVVAGLYAFENNVASPKNEDYKTTCLILGVAKAGVTTYYRVNLNLNSIGQSLVRNNVYKVAIQNVKGPGANTPQEAYESGELLLDISVNGWIEAQEGNVKYDGDNLFAVPTTKITFAPEAETRYFSIFTSGVGALTMSQKMLPNGLYATLDPAKKELIVSADASLDKRDGWIELAFAGMRTIIYISQTGDHDEYLDLSTYSIPSFAASKDYPMQINPIAVTSSGPWTATIYDDAFTFGFGTSKLKQTGVSGETFKIATFRANPDNTARYSFVLLSLDSNPDVNRVIVLSQKGTGGISLSPAISQLLFNANGQEIDAAGTVIASTIIHPSAGDDPSSWTATLNGSGASKFTLSALTGATQSLSIAGDPVSVTASRNIESTEITSTMRVRLTDAPSVFKEILVKQLAHTVSLQSAAIPTISASGGTTPDITVTSSDAWVASITTENCVATLSASSGVSGDKFNVIFEANTYPGKTPKATVVVSINGVPAVSRTIVINQTALDPRRLVIQSSANTYGSMNTVGVPAYFNSWNSSLRNTSYFGNSSSASVYTGGDFTFTTGSTINQNSTIYSSVQGVAVGYHAGIISWLNADNRNFLVVMDDISWTQTTDLMRLLSPSFTSVDDNAPVSTQKTPSTRPAGPSHQKVWDYIFVNGPFGGVTNLAAVQFFGDASCDALSSYPATTVPILKVASGRVHVAIDPTLKMLYIGDCDMFSTLGNNNSFPAGSDKWKIMNNLIAFMVNSSQYGDTFLNDFR